MSRSRILEQTLGTGSTESLSGVTRSRILSSIEKMTFDRKRDTLSFFAASGTQMVHFPSHQIYDRLPYATTRIGDIDYIVSAD